ncbi:hypothetical protein OVY01_15900 [Robbsia sp. Bb-Pol-6]|uniref:Uncharacterized protein n=1 Tax=Robbsia betulipollinis TaxID=2981849 RepID=A0ABT3ZR17_9BURK|nr:hypothetical protein [Robbsia betulipollinis]MCY0388665.1 hypothetical protein [Robbsia betulipollinis]
MKKMTLWFGSIALASAAAVAHAKADAQTPGSVPAAATTPQDLATSSSTQDVAAAPAASESDISPLAANRAQPADAAQYYSRAQVGDEPAQTTGAAMSGADSYGASLYGSSAAGQRRTAALMPRTADKP